MISDDKKGARVVVVRRKEEMDVAGSRVLVCSRRQGNFHSHPLFGRRFTPGLPLNLSQHLPPRAQSHLRGGKALCLQILTSAFVGLSAYKPHMNGQGHISILLLLYHTGPGPAEPRKDPGVYDALDAWCVLMNIRLE